MTIPSCKHAISLNGKREQILRADLLTVAKSMNIKKADKIVDEITETVSQWRQYAQAESVDLKKMEAIAKTLILDL